MEVVWPENPPLKVDLGPARAVVRALNLLNPDWLRQGRVNLQLLDDQAIAKLNADYSGNDAPTDVLSFNYSEDGAMPVTEGELGDIAISYQTAGRQARQAGTGMDQEIAQLVLHGVMHICGLDHADLGGQIAMEDWQDKIMTVAGVTQRQLEWK
jgi:probable rRNA maturation factor